MIVDDNKKSEALSDKTYEILINKSMATASITSGTTTTEFDSPKLSDLINITPTKNNLIDSRDCAKPEKKVI